MLRTIADWFYAVKKEHSYLVVVSNYPAEYPARLLAWTVRLRPDSKIWLSGTSLMRTTPTTTTMTATTTKQGRDSTRGRCNCTPCRTLSVNLPVERDIFLIWLTYLLCLVAPSDTWPKTSSVLCRRLRLQLCLNPAIRISISRCRFLSDVRFLRGASTLGGGGTCCPRFIRHKLAGENVGLYIVCIFSVLDGG